jgi:hypothetical protein
VLLALVLVALSAAIGLHVRFLLLARRARGDTTHVLDATERCFRPSFDSALDAVVILDGQGICREAIRTLFRVAKGLKTPPWDLIRRTSESPLFVFPAGKQIA